MHSLMHSLMHFLMHSLIRALMRSFMRVVHPYHVFFIHEFIQSNKRYYYAFSTLSPS